MFTASAELIKLSVSERTQGRDVRFIAYADPNREPRQCREHKTMIRSKRTRRSYTQLISIGLILGGYGSRGTSTCVKLLMMLVSRQIRITGLFI